jgi:hypothetical protein
MRSTEYEKLLDELSAAMTKIDAKDLRIKNLQGLVNALQCELVAVYEELEAK